MRKHMRYQLIRLEKTGIIRVKSEITCKIFKYQLSDKNNHINNDQIQNNGSGRLRGPVTIIRHSIKI